jgi:hypothetical protein
MTRRDGIDARAGLRCTEVLPASPRSEARAIPPRAEVRAASARSEASAVLSRTEAPTASPRTKAPADLPFGRIDWSVAWLAPLRERGMRWQNAALTSYGAYLGELNQDARAEPRATGRGAGLAFIAQDELPVGAAYEGHIAMTGRVPTRYNLHDFFNASIWFQYPRIKAALNARQAAEIEARGIGPTRGGVRDALTLFDENAVLLACSDPQLADALRRFDWHTVFIAARSAWGTHCEARIFGHALLEKLVAPYKACTGHGWIVDVPRNYFAWPDVERRAFLDHAVAHALSNDTVTSSRFAPLPVLGVPGWWRDNELPGFYDDPAVFRKGRRNRSDHATN